MLTNLLTVGPTIYVRVNIYVNTFLLLLLFIKIIIIILYYIIGACSQAEK